MVERRLVGLHLRASHSLHALMDKADALELPIFQCFLVDAITGRLLYLSAREKRDIADRLKNYQRTYVHVSYHANACRPNGLMMLRRELVLAKALGFSAAVLHPGSGKWCGDRQQAMNVLVDTLNTVLSEQTSHMPIFLENSAHGKLSIGGDVTDFGYIMSCMKFPELVRLCIDTAHAYAYGYNVADSDEQEKFITLLTDVVGVNSLALLHLNDTTQQLGGCIDRHTILGQGHIGERALRTFAQHPVLAQVPIILELPQVDEQTEQAALHHARTLFEGI
jgi:deoxyribonuclease IV